MTDNANDKLRKQKVENSVKANNKMNLKPFYNINLSATNQHALFGV